MANTTFNTRLKLKYDTYVNWSTNNPVLLKGEFAVVEVPADTGSVQQEPAILVKCGDGVKHFNELDYISAKSANSYSWSLQPTKPTYTASEISGLADYIAGEIQDTNTQYKIEADKDNPRKFYLYAKEIGGSFTIQDTIEIPEDVLTTGSANGTVAFNGTDVAVKGLGSAAYTNADAYDEAGAAEAVMNSLLGTDSDAATVATIKGVQKAAAAAQSAADNAQTAADNAQTDVDALEAKVGAVPSDKTVVEMIEDAQREATYDDTAIKAAIKANADAIDVLNGTESVDGSVAKTVKDSINDFATKMTDDGTINTFKELVDYAASHTSEYSELAGEVTANKNAIATLNGTADQAGSVAKAVADAKSELQANIDNKVDKVEGKGLSTNDYTTEEKEKLAGIADGAQVNVIETVKVNGVALTPDASKAVDVTVPTGALAEKDKVAEADLETALATKINGKVDATACGDIISHNASEFATAGHDHDDVYSKLGHIHKIEDLEQESYIILDAGTATTVI